MTTAGKPLHPKAELAKDLALEFVGCVIFSAAVQCFSSPNNIAPGGVTGVSILLEYLFGIPISFLNFAINIPLLLLAWRFLGRKFTLRTLVNVAMLTVTLELAAYLPVYRGEMILAALFGGVLEGIGLGLVFSRGATTGGTDVASRLLQLKFPHLSMGRLMLAVDGCVLVASALVYQNIENALYGLIAIFTATSIIDNILYGMDMGKVMLVISNAEKEIAVAISQRLERGCTFLEGRGSYTGENRPVLLCAVRRNQFHIVKRLVYAIDPAAFVLALDASEVIGEGFKNPG